MCKYTSQNFHTLLHLAIKDWELNECVECLVFMDKNVGHTFEFQFRKRQNAKKVCFKTDCYTWQVKNHL